MKKKVLLLLSFVLFVTFGFSQTDRFWSANNDNRSGIVTDKAVARLSFPKQFNLFSLKIEPLRQELFAIVDKQAFKHSTIISLPNADGGLEQFEVFEASNFEPDLQARFPEIRAFSGRGITDKYATLKLSISPQGIQTMIFRTDKENEFIEPYSNDHTIYAAFKSHRELGKLPWACTTDDKQAAADLNSKITNSNIVTSSTGELKTMRLAQSVTAEYSNYFGAFNASQVGLVLAAINATLTRCNGCYEKDLAVHLNLIASSTNVIFYDPATDPYSPAPNIGPWNGQLQATLTSIIGEANYDIGHLFGASGGGGNAGCIGCVCVNGQKGSGITSPADNIPQGDNFDIDYVVHEVGHQMGANHTFSFSLEGTGVNKEVGAGITIMGYAGITSYDPAPHSIDIYHEASIAQIQANLAIKTCPITTNITANNATPVIAPMSNYTIPISTPFTLTGSATDADGDPLTYCWEQDDNATTSGANSVASPAKLTGPNWLSFSPTASPTRLFPKLSTILAGLNVTPPLPGGDAICNIEALSSVARTLNFRLTVRDNHPYSSTAPVAVAQTAFTNTVVTVASAGPFQVTSPNTNIALCGGFPQAITWDVNGTDVAPVSCANVKISLSTDGGLTFPTVLLASTPNDGNELVTLPNTVTTTARIKIEAIGNIFFDISNANFSITAPQAISINSQPVSSTICLGATTSFSVGVTGTSLAYQWQESTNGTTWNNITNGGVYSGALTNTLTLTNATAAMSGYQYRAIASDAPPCGSVNFVTSVVSTLTVNVPPAITAQPAANTVCVGSNATYTTTATGTALTYQWQVSTAGAGGPWNNVTNGGVYSGTATATLTVTGTTAAMNTYQYRCVINGTCAATATTSANAALTVISPVSITAQPLAATAICSTGNTSFTVTGNSSVTILYKWQVSTNGGATWSDINNAAPYSGATTGTLSITNVPTTLTGYLYRALLYNATCTTPTVSNNSTLTVNVLPTVSIAAHDTAIQAGQSTVITATTTPTTGLSIAWYKDGVLINGANSNTYTVDVNKLGVYKVVVTDLATGTCINQSNLLTISALPSDKLFVFPSPNDGQFTVTYYNSNTSPTTQGITIYDSRGSKVYNNIFPVTQAYQLHKIDLRRYSAGVYFVFLRDANGKKIKTTKVMIHH